jgi:hypothetical protein
LYESWVHHCIKCHIMFMGDVIVCSLVDKCHQFLNMLPHQGNAIRGSRCLQNFSTCLPN